MEVLAMAIDVLRQPHCHGALENMLYNVFVPSDQPGGFILYGLRGVGKTMLLNHIRRQAEAEGVACVRIEAPEGRSLPALLAPALPLTLRLPMALGGGGQPQHHDAGAIA